ncbi:catalytic activity protein [[Candida] boidinii]|nr:catalytic activity protein [[Candida] boidinii]OWB77474.1 catalytic activity protein [[Candida] boidinii]
MSADKVLVTGATGFVATHVVDVLLSKGYKVIGTARSEAKYEPLLKEYQAKYPNGDLSFEIVKDIAAPNAFDEVLKKYTDIKHVLHTASPFSFGLNQSLEEAYKIPAVEGTKNILNAIRDYGHQIEHVVITSSNATMVEFDRVIQPVFHENYWSSLTWDKVGDNEAIAYCCSKKLAEEAAWEFMKTESPNFALTTLTPPYIFGPQVFDSQVGKTLNTSNQILVNALSIDPKTTEAQKENSALYVDVRDVAFAHVAPLSTTTMNNKRIFPTSGPFCIQSILDSLNKIPSLKGKVAVGDSTYCDSEEYQKVKYAADNTESIKLLGDFKFIKLDQSTADTIEQFYKVNNL